MPLSDCTETVKLYNDVHICDPQEKQRMTDKLEDTSLRLKDEMDLYRKMMDKLKQNRHQFQKEKEAMQEVGGLLCNQVHIQSGFFLFIFLSLQPCQYDKILHQHYTTQFICPFSCM